MPDDPAGLSNARSVLMAEFDVEVTRMAQAAERDNPVEAVMRIRALADIADLLGTEALLRLARDLSDLSAPAPSEPVSIRYRQSGCA